MITFDLAVGDIAGQMSVCLPHRSLDPIMDQLSTQVWAIDPGLAESSAAETAIRHRLLNVSLGATVILGEVELSTSAIMAIREGDVITLHTAAKSDLSMTIDGLGMFRCRPGQSSGHVAVQIERILTPVDLDS